jgi:hypothetical protein
VHSSFFGSRLKRSAGLAILLVLWAPSVAFGIYKALAYSYTPGRAAKATAEWPGNPWVTRAPGGFALLMFVHPQCSCSRVSIDELAEILASRGGGVTAAVFFYAPAGMPAEWAHSDLWREADLIPGVRAIADRNGEAARRFGAFTSGETLLYGSDGRLAFHGGITPARGHAGDSAGRDAILSLLNGRWPERSSTSVFGCSIRGDD